MLRMVEIGLLKHKFRDYLYLSVSKSSVTYNNLKKMEMHTKCCLYEFSQLNEHNAAQEFVLLFMQDMVG